MIDQHDDDQIKTILHLLDFQSDEIKAIKASLDRLHQKIDSRSEDRTKLGFPRHWGVKTSEDEE